MPEITRRNFLGGLVVASMYAATSGITFDQDPERLLWTPGAKKIFIPRYDLLLTREEMLDYFWKQHHHTHMLTIADQVRLVQNIEQDFKNWDWERTNSGVLYKRKWIGGR